MVQFGKPEDDAHSIAHRRKTTERQEVCFLVLTTSNKGRTLDKTGGDVKTKRRTEIIIETDRLLILRRNTARVFTHCDRCRARIEMVTPMEAAAIAGVSVRTINRWVENGVLHFAETKEGLLLICPNFPPLAPLKEVNK